MVNLSIITPRGDRIAPAIRDGNDRRVLKAITAQVVTAAIWRRRLPAELEGWLAAQKPARMLELGLVARPKILFDELNQAADAFGIVDSHARQLFLTDVCELARDFARIVKAISVEVRLKVVTEKAFQAVGAAGCDGIRLITVYQVAGVRHLRKARGGLGSDWQLLSSGTSLPLGAAAVVVLKNRPAGARASRDAVCPSAPPNAFRSFRLFYILEIRP